MALTSVCAAMTIGLAGCESLRRAIPNSKTDAGRSTADGSPSERPLTVDQLSDPTVCQQCHPGQFAEWAGSMHAYASRDPVFLAMNALGQRETQGRLGKFCVQCHAPLAVANGLTTDGLNLDQVPERYQGVTCYFCHNVASVEGTHNNPLKLAFDTTLRGPFGDPTTVIAHHSEYSPFLDTQDSKSSQLCGSCHDVALEAHFAPADVALERTFEEWKSTLFNTRAAQGGLTCNGCHMPATQTRSQSAVGQYPARTSRRHDFEGVDIATTEFPARERQRVLVQQFLDSSLLAELCVSREGVVSVTLENAAGHNWPSGASHDRLGWLELEVFDRAGLVYRTTDPETEVQDDASAFVEPAPTLTDHVSDEQGNQAHFFWQVKGVKSETLLGVASRDPQSSDYHRERKTWQFDTLQVAPDSVERVELTVKLRPIKLAVLRDLEGRAYLSSDVIAAQPTFALLPERCHTSEEIENHADVLIGARSECDPSQPLHRTTLTWDKDVVDAATRNVRDIVLNGSTAKCFSHPTYLPPGQ